MNTEVENIIKREIIKKTLLSDDVFGELEKKKKELFKIIPELKKEDGFDQKNDWHIYDVWNHTKYAVSKSDKDLKIRLALLLHDIGKPCSYQEENGVRHFKGHSEKSAQISMNVLKRLRISSG